MGLLAGWVVISIKIDRLIMAQRSNELRKKIENYSYGLNDHLDLGHKSNTFKGLNEKTAEQVAIKVVDLRSKDREGDQLNIEIEILKKVQHPNLIHCLDVYSTVNNCYIITQFCDQGDLDNRITTRGEVTETEALIYFKDALSGFLFLAQEKYIHGGLKPSCLFLKDKVVKIGGFSNARKMKDKENRKEIKFNSYQSPQSVKENIFNHKSDIWSLGMILYVLLHGALPWQFQDKAGLLDKVGKPYHINKELSEDTKDFLKRTLTARENRLGLQELISHPLVLRLGANSSPGPIADRRQVNVSRVERQFNAQINWMRFLLRLIERILNYPQELNTLVLKFVMTRQLAVQFEQLRRAIEKVENPFNIASWSEFLREKEKGRKYKEVLAKYESRYEKTLGSYRKFMEKVSGNSSLGYLTPILNDNFILSEYNSMVAIKSSLEEIRKLWTRIIKQYPPKGKYDHDSPFRFRAELLLLDFLVTYYQLNCMLIDDFTRPEYFEKNCKLDLILEYQPVDLDASHLEEIEHKLTQLAIITP